MYRGSLPPSYVLNEAEPYEIAMLIRGLQIKEKDSWEQTRMIAYTTAQVNCTKRLKATDIMRFPWDEDSKGTDTVVSTEDMERLRLKAQNFIKNK